MTALEHAAELRPNHLAALRTLSALYEEKGFRRKAAEALERALATAPEQGGRPSAPICCGCCSRPGGRSDPGALAGRTAA